MSKMNCWDFQKCGREPGGLHAQTKGVCPAAEETRLNGVNRGINAGRCCWLVAGTYCSDVEQGTFVQKFHECHACDFFQEVMHQEERHFTVA